MKCLFLINVDTKAFLTFLEKNVTVKSYWTNKMERDW